MLYDPRAHEPLTDAPWDPDAVATEIRAIARDAEDHRRDGACWAVHPLDAEPGDPEVLARWGAHVPGFWTQRLKGAPARSSGRRTGWRAWSPRSPGLHGGGTSSPASPTRWIAPRSARAAAGPLRKGAGLCHGTAGNGFGFLKLFARTGDEQWLERARRFAMHAIRQTAAARERYGQGRHTLWTGDLGTAHYLQQCLAATAELPLLDFSR